MQLFSLPGFGCFQPSSFSAQDDPVCSFDEAVGLWVFYGCEALFDADVSQVVLEPLINELGSIRISLGSVLIILQFVSFEETEYVLACDLR